MAWPVDSFISANDFTGKTVIPFCTSSSGLGQSGELLRDAAGAETYRGFEPTKHSKRHKNHGLAV